MGLREVVASLMVVPSEEAEEQAAFRDFLPWGVELGVGLQSSLEGRPEQRGQSGQREE